MQIHQAILDALAEDITAEIGQDNRGIYFQFLTGTKSDILIRQRADGRLDTLQRYNTKSIVNTFDEICALVRNQMTSPRANNAWEVALKKRGLLEND